MVAFASCNTSQKITTINWPHQVQHRMHIHTSLELIRQVYHEWVSQKQPITFQSGLSTFNALVKNTHTHVGTCHFQTPPSALMDNPLLLWCMWLAFEPFSLEKMLCVCLVFGHEHTYGVSCASQFDCVLMFGWFSAKYGQQPELQLYVCTWRWLSLLAVAALACT